MSLAGGAAVVIWNDVLEDARTEFLAWHNREHIPERVAIPGFRRGRRGRAVAGGPEFLTLYEVDDIAVVTDGPYLERLNAPSDWTRRMLPQFRTTIRSICSVDVSHGGGVGGFMATVRLARAIEGRDLEAARAGLSREAAHVLRSSAEVTGVHLLLRDLAASGREIEEARLRTETVDMPGTVLLVEAIAAGPAEAGARALAQVLGGGFGQAADGDLGVYRHEFCLTAEDCARPALAAGRS